MPRDLTVAAAAAVIAESVPRAMAVELSFGSGVVRLATTTWDLVIDGDTFIGVGVLGSISTVEESVDLASTQLTLALSGIPADTVAIALGEAYQNRAAIVYDVPLNATTLAPIADPIKVFVGRMDIMTVKRDAGGARVEIRLTNRLVDWERPRRILFSDEQQQRAHPGDTSFRYAASLGERNVIWPSASAFKKGLFGS
jgi:hypothetical protein